MGSYKIKKGHKPDMESVLKEVFGDYQKQDGKFYASYGVISLQTWIERKELHVNLKTEPSTDDELLKKSIDAYNKFLFLGTGYTSKGRRKKLMKNAGTD
jgi:hypothetical protein